MSWTQERVDHLKMMWAEGYSGTQIADSLGCFSRSAVLGKIQRLGLIRRNGGSDQTEAQPQRRPPRQVPGISAPTPTEPLPALPVAPAAEDEPPATGAAEAILALRTGLCKWPIGEVQSPEFRFCMGEAGEKPYCAVHSLLAYRPAVYQSQIVRKAWRAA